MHVFIVDLHADDRTAVAEKEPFYLPGYLFVQLLCARKKTFVQTAKLKGLSIHPVGDAAVADFSVIERTDPENDVQPVLSAQFNKPAEVPLAVEPENPFLFLVMDPEHIGGDNIDAAHFHLDKLVFPSDGGHS